MRVPAPSSALHGGRFTRAKMSLHTGLADEVLAHWTKEGLLSPLDPVSGSGRHKEFDSLELEKAEILGQLRNFGRGIEALRWLANVIDHGRKITEELPQLANFGFYRAAWVMEKCWRFSQGEPVKLSGYIDDEWIESTATSLENIIQHELRDRTEFPYDVVEKIGPILLSRFPSRAYRQGAHLIDYLLPDYVLDHRVTGVWLIWREADDWTVYEDTDNNMSGLKVIPPVGLSLYVSRVLRDLWGIEHVNKAR